MKVINLIKGVRFHNKNINSKRSSSNRNSNYCNSGSSNSKSYQPNNHLNLALNKEREIFNKMIRSWKFLIVIQSSLPITKAERYKIKENRNRVWRVVPI